jgi:hypothetical protein
VKVLESNHPYRSSDPFPVLPVDLNSSFNRQARVYGKTPALVGPEAKQAPQNKLARQKGMMVGGVHKEFSKAMGSRLKGLSKEEFRIKKHDWIKSELAKGRTKKKTAA